MIIKLQKKAKEIPFLYKLWFYYKKSKLLNLKLPKRSDHFYLDSFPRSGNSYVSYFLQHFYPDLEFSHHLHTVAGIKIAIKKGITPFILIRNPLDVVASYLIMKVNDNNGSLNENKLICDILDEYIDYYQFVYNNLDVLNILPFATIRNIQALNVFISNRILQINNSFTVEDLNAFHDYFVKLQYGKPSDATSLPNDKRNYKKELIKENILNIDDYKKANQLYLNIIFRNESD